ncbi:sulfatase-like hydrolase/transferase, partial [Salmonella enterica]|uniref:sulfatase-like hydrolase/transferase n=1 Tax=Salmonella enterica TaxID=28901 RepID=UPI00351AB00C
MFILADDLGWNDISWNNPLALSPNLEKLAREGVILDQSYVQPICTPTRSALMTGRYPYTLGRQH